MDTDLDTMMRRVLRPLIAYLMKRGIGYIALRDLLKKIFVEEALKSRQNAEMPTDSMISLVTGIHRREVKRLREAALHEDSLAGRDPMAGVNTAARVVATWVTAAAFRGEQGEPVSLGVRAGDAEPGFDALLRVAKVDVRARTVIEELQRGGIVEYGEDKRLYLLRTAYTPGTPTEQMLFLGANVSDHMRSALHNLAGGGAPFIERALFHNAIGAEPLHTLRPVFAAMADKLLRQANEQLLASSMAATDTAGTTPATGATGALKRLRLGVYYYETDATEAP